MRVWCNTTEHWQNAPSPFNLRIKLCCFSRKRMNRPVAYRHSMVELTAEVYTHLGITDAADALQGLSLATLPAEGRAPGTDNLSPTSLPSHALNHAPNHAPLMHQTPCFLVHFGAQSHNNNLTDYPTAENDKTPMDTHENTMDIDNFNTAGDGTRTHNSQLGRQSRFRAEKPRNHL